MFKAALFFLVVEGAFAQAPLRPVDYVNPLIGTAPFEDGRYLGGNPPKGEELYTGTVVPGAMALDGVVKLSPDTGFHGIFHVRGSGYRYTDSSIMGFSHTHHEYNRYANVRFMPVVGAVKTTPGTLEKPEEGYRSRKDPKREHASPGYYSVFLSDYEIKVDLTATKNAGFHRYTFPQTKDAHVIVDLSTSQQAVLEAHIEVPDKQHLAGWQKCKGYTVYFYAAFERPFASHTIWAGGTGAHVSYAGSQVIQAKVGISSANLETAKRNLAEEIPGWDFDQVRRQTESGWNGVLSRVEVEGGTQADRVNFYTSLYRVLESENLVNWPVAGGIQAMIRRESTAERLANTKWSTTHAGFWGPSYSPWIAGMYARGLKDFDVAAAYDAMRRSATDPKVGWDRLEDYRQFGYIPARDAADAPRKMPDVVNRTLGYAYEDYAIAQLAKALGRTLDYEYFLARSGNYRQLFDPATGFMRARRLDGSWATPFDPSEPNGMRYYREGTAWHYLWLVPHDIQGLIGLLGGREPFVKKLEEFFSTPYHPKEPMRDVTGVIGQYVHGNETDRQVPYYYNYAGAPWKTQEIVRKIMRELHKAEPGGLCGMDDNGYLTGWYVYSAMGFYPVEPAGGYYVIGSPVFSKMTIQMGRGAFVVEARGASERNIYIQSATLNGKPLSRSYFHHSEMVPGGRLVFEMGPAPNKQWAAGPDAAPPSVTPTFIEK